MKQVRKTFFCSTLLSFFLMAGLSFSSTLSIGDVSAPEGSTVQVPVNIDDATGVGGFQLDITYNAAMLQATAVTDGSLTAGWWITPNLTVAGEIQIIGLDTSFEGIAEGTGSLCVLHFKVCDITGDAAIEFGDATIADTSGQTLPKTATLGGTITVTPAEDLFNVSGTVAYPQGTYGGMIYVGLFTSPDFSAAPFRGASIAAPGPYIMENVPAGEYWVAAYRDVDDTGSPGAGDPFGTYPGNPFTVVDTAVAGIDITLTDPVTREISIPGDLTGAPGSTVDVPVNIDNAAGVAEFQFVIDYDSDILEYIGKERGTLLSGAWFLLDPELGEGKFEVLGWHPTAELSGGAGSLVILKFEVKDNADIGEVSPIEFATVRVDPINFIRDSADAIIPANYTNGQIEVVTGYPLGDVNRDGEVTPLDAQWAFEFYMGFRALDEQQEILADANKDGEVTPLDAQWIFEAYMGFRELE